MNKETNFDVCMVGAGNRGGRAAKELCEKSLKTGIRESAIGMGLSFSSLY